MKKINLGLIGAGTIGSGVIRILQENAKEIAKRSGLQLNLHTICDLDIDKTKALLSNTTIKVTDSYQEVLTNPEITTIIELIGGITTAYEVAAKALQAGKIVVTANKALISEKGAELFALAKQNNTEIGYEAAVGGTIPIIRSMKTGFVTNSYQAIYGILNGTTNYILTKMEEEGLDYATALQQAQELGFAEQDPTFDVEGIDAGHKLSILGGLASGKCIPTREIYIEGIAKISKTEIRVAKELGYRIKLLGVYKFDGETIEARVHPTMVPLNHPIAGVMNEVNAIFLQTSYSGPAMLVGNGAGSLPTANAVLSDVVFYNTRIGRDSAIVETNYSQEAKLLPIGESSERFYIRFNTVDKPGVLGEITQILGKNQVSIASFRQSEVDEEPVELIVITHAVQENKLRKAIKEIDALTIAKKSSVVVRLENIS
ncbi:MAG: homoserine dehydrogenase [Spirochaetota bacterium]